MRFAAVTVHLSRNPQAFPLAAAMLAANAPPCAETKILDLYMDSTAEKSVQKILELDPDVIGFPVYLWNVKRVLSIAGKIRSAAPGIRIAAGGPEVTADYGVFEKTGLFDAIFSGEGEHNFSVYLEMLCKGVEHPGVFIQSSPLSISELNSPFLAGTVDPGEYDGILWELSRGCIFNCSFCFESRGLKKVRSSDLGRIEKELKLFAAAGVNQIFVLDPTFNLNREKAKKVLKLIMKTAPEIHFTFEIRSEFLDRETAELFSQITCSVQIGLQSADIRVLKNVNRSMDRDDFYNKILMLHEEGAVYGFDLIYGLPGDTYSGFCKSLDFALSLRPNHLDIFPLAVLKGTELYEEAENFHLNWNREKPYTVYDTPDFSAGDMEKARRLANACNIFYNKGEAVPWFYLIPDALKTSPSQLLEEFADFLKENNSALPEGTGKADLPAIVELQTGFVSNIFRKEGREREGKAAVDIIRWMSGISYLLGREDLESLTVDFSFNINQLVENIEMGIDSLDELASFTEMTPCRGKLEKTEKEVVLRIIES